MWEHREGACLDELGRGGVAGKKQILREVHCVSLGAQAGTTGQLVMKWCRVLTEKLEKHSS